MAKRPDVSTLASGFRSSNKLNDNFDGIKEAFDNTISRDGSGPNEMLADFDLNGYRILNTPAPVDPTDVVRLQDIAEVSGDVAVFKLDTDGDNATPDLLVNIGAASLSELRLSSLRPEQFGDSVGTGGDDTTAILACRAALLLQGGGTMRLSRKTYNMSQTFPLDTGNYDVELSIVGEGKESILRQTGVGVDAITIGTTTLIRDPRLQHFTLTNTSSGGDLIKGGAQGCKGGVFEIEMVQANPAKRCFDLIGNFYNNTYQGYDWYQHPATTVSGFRCITNGTTFNENVFKNIRPYNAKTVQFFELLNTNTTTWNLNNSWENVNFQVCPAGGFKYSNLKNCRFRGISFWDIGGAYTGHLIHSTFGPGGSGDPGFESAGNVFENIQRLGDSLGVGIQDIFVEHGQDSVFINCYTDSSPSYDWNGKRVTVIGRMAGQINASQRDQILSFDNILTSLAFAGATGAGAFGASVTGGFLQILPQANSLGFIFGTRSSGAVDSRIAFAGTDTSASLFPLQNNWTRLGEDGVAFKDVTVGTGYNVNAQQVVGARGAAVADATDAASAITQLNTLLARCRAHGLIAP